MKKGRGVSATKPPTGYSETVSQILPPPLSCMHHHRFLPLYDDCCAARMHLDGGIVGSEQRSYGASENRIISRWCARQIQVILTKSPYYPTAQVCPWAINCILVEWGARMAS